ncbi:MAG: M20/M25/M40 family metallo-hydrolase, partial [Candidatus Latescibacteria bacterium]|nr:M20/M25/M40 family metallo-hydrolase [Candidatus Latescibacterota bacterium]
AWIDIETTGRAAHGSRPDEGIDAIVLMGEVLVALRDLERTTLADRTHPMLGHPSVHASLIAGGKELSTYPDKCTLQVERRTIPGETREMVEQELHDLLARLSASDPRFQGKAELFFYRDPLEIDRDAPIVQLIRRVATRVLGREPAYSHLTGWLDSGILCAHGIPTVVFGPGGEGFHAAVEYTYRDQVPLCAQVLAETVVEFCGTQ